VECEAGWCSSTPITTLSAHYAQALACAELHPIPVKRLHDLAGRSALRQMLAQAEIPVCATCRATLDFSANQVANYASMRQVLTVFFELVRPFVLGLGISSEEEYTWLQEQAGHEMRLPSFEGNWNLLILWGQKGARAGHAVQVVTAGKAAQVVMADAHLQAGGGQHGPHATC
jgi:hypothetical protein